MTIVTVGAVDTDVCTDESIVEFGIVFVILF